MTEDRASVGGKPLNGKDLLRRRGWLRRLALLLLLLLLHLLLTL